MTIKESATGTDRQAVGRVVSTYDNVKAVSPDGMERLLAAESPVFAYDRIITEGNARASILIDYNAQDTIELGGMTSVLIDEDIFGGTGPEEIAGAAAEAEQLQESFFVKNIDRAVPEPSVTDGMASPGGHIIADLDHVTSRGDISSAAADKFTVIFDQSDYPDLDNPDSQVDPLDNLIDPDDTVS